MCHFFARSELIMDGADWRRRCGGEGGGGVCGMRSGGQRGLGWYTGWASCSKPRQEWGTCLSGKVTSDIGELCGSMDS